MGMQAGAARDDRRHALLLGVWEAGPRALAMARERRRGGASGVRARPRWRLVDVGRLRRVTVAERPAEKQRGNAAKRVADTSTPPWKRWRKISRHGRAIRFMETYCRAPKGVGYGKPLRLDAFQKEFLEEALADGIDTAIESTGRGNGKSTLGGGIATWAAFDDDETGAPQVPIVATTVGQAIRSCYGAATAMVELEPELSTRSLVYTGIATPRVSIPYNRGELFPISNDPDGLQGLDYSLGVIDEIGFQPVDSYVALQGAAGKRARSLLLGLGTHGVKPDNALRFLRKRIRDAGGIPGIVLREYQTPAHFAIDDPAGWAFANPALAGGFLRESAIRLDLQLMPEGRFRIFRLNQIVEGVESWLGANGAAIWDGLLSPYTAVAGAPTWLAVDIGIQRDSSAVAIVQKRPDNRLHAWARVWTPTTDQPVDVTNVMAYIRQLARFARVEGVAFDPRFFDVPAKLLADERIPMVRTDQSVERMTPMDGQLLAIVKSGGLAHGGDPTLRAHVLNAVARDNERGFMLSKGKSNGPIDAARALSMAVDLAVHAKPRKPRKPRVAMGF